jgi:diguanylate cyclase (GGDEF)-like protein
MIEDRTRLLLVEDDEDDFVLTRDMLHELEVEGARFVLEWVRDFETGLKRIAARAHDLYLLDYRLGERDGLELLREGLTLNATTPFIMLTGQGTRHTDLMAMQLGAADYLLKAELNAPTLERTIRYALERSHTLEALRRSEEHYRAVVSSLEEGVLLLGQNHEVLAYNAAVEKILGIDPKHIAALPRLMSNGAKWIGGNSSNTDFGYTIIAENGAPFRLEHYPPWYSLETGLPQSNVVIGICQPEKPCTWVSVNSRPLFHTNETRPYAIAVSFFDLTERKRAERQIAHQAYHDPLTGLANRYLLTDRLERSIVHAQRIKKSFAVALLDLDHFKLVNDTLGHDAGDVLLQQVAKRFTDCLRAEDTVARMGGDEFCFVLEEIASPDAAAHVAQTLLGALSEPFKINEREFFVTASLGLSLFPDDSEQASTLLKHADTAMFQAKASGKNVYRFFTSTMNQAVLERLDLQTELRRALEQPDQHFELHYQPQFDLSTNQVVGLEALVRWNHPQHGLLLPGRFIAAAEEGGLIGRLGDWVLDRSFKQIKDWQQAKFVVPKMAVNVSAAQFLSADLSLNIKTKLEHYDLDPSQLELELTESIIMRDTEDSMQQLRALQEIGVSIIVDDFGTGYSSLSYLRRLPVNHLKVDRSFVQASALDVSQDLDSSVITEAIVSLAHTLGLGAIAEGVETPAQLEFVRRLGCDRVQGFLLSRAVPANEVERDFLTSDFLLANVATRV